MQLHTNNKNRNIDEPASKPVWSAVYGLVLGVAGLIVSLLMPMVCDLHATEGIVGQAISITSIVAIVASLFISVVTWRLDCHWMLVFSVLQILFNVLVAFGLGQGRLLSHVSRYCQASVTSEARAQSLIHRVWRRLGGHGGGGTVGQLLWRTTGLAQHISVGQRPGCAPLRVAITHLACFTYIKASYGRCHAAPAQSAECGVGILATMFILWATPVFSLTEINRSNLGRLAYCP
jgi:hypothetical protein